VSWKYGASDRLVLGWRKTSRSGISPRSICKMSHRTPHTAHEKSRQVVNRFHACVRLGRGLLSHERNFSVHGRRERQLYELGERTNPK
jgi:hypothetical protein